MNRSYVVVLALCVLGIGVVLAGCITAQVQTATITSPQKGAQIPAGNIQVSVDVGQFTLVNKTGQTNVPGEGHLLYYMDVSSIPIVPGSPAITPKGTSPPTVNTSYTWENVTPGNHTFAVQLVNNDNTPLNPAVVDKTYAYITGETTPPTTSPTQTPTPLPYMNLTTPTTPTPPPQTAPVGANVTVGIQAHHASFNRSFVVVPPCANVTVVFDNMDGGMPHTFSAYYNGSDARSIIPNSSNVIFQGERVVGPATHDYHFKAPCTPGDYYFQCDVHPDVMNGQFIVEPPANQTAPSG